MKSVRTEYLRPAAAQDVPALLALRAEAEGWLRTKGTDQWSDRETGERAISKWRASIDEGRAWVVVGKGDEVLATVSRGPVDRDFWTDADRPETALYLYKLIVAREASGRQLGTRVIDWMSRLAAPGRTNLGPHRHVAHEHRAARLLRTVGVPTRTHRGTVPQALGMARSTPGR